MKLLLADDDPLFCRLVQGILKNDYTVVTVGDGESAWRVLTGEAVPRIALVNWMMPALDGLELCRRIRETASTEATYVLLITAEESLHRLLTTLHGGADDYIVKPFAPAELRARLKVAERIVALQDGLSGRIAELEQALEHVHLLQRLLPICSYCRRVRDDQDYWTQLESYLAQHSDLLFSHSICPDCYERHWKPEVAHAADERGGGGE